MEWINHTGVKISKHSYLQRVHDHCFHYINHERDLQINIDEGETMRLHIPLHPRWLEPNKGDAIDAELREQIVREVKKAMKFMRLHFELVEE